MENNNGFQTRTGPPGPTKLTHSSSQGHVQMVGREPGSTTNKYIHANNQGN